MRAIQELLLYGDIYLLERDYMYNLHKYIFPLNKLDSRTRLINNENSTHSSPIKYLVILYLYCFIIPLFQASLCYLYYSQFKQVGLFDFDAGLQKDSKTTCKLQLYVMQSNQNKVPFNVTNKGIKYMYRWKNSVFFVLQRHASLSGQVLLPCNQDQQFIINQAFTL